VKSFSLPHFGTGVQNVRKKLCLLHDVFGKNQALQQCPQNRVQDRKKELPLPIFNQAESHYASRGASDF